MRSISFSSPGLLLACATALAAEAQPPQGGSSSTDLVKALIAAVPVIVSPIIAWTLSRSSTSRDETVMNRLTKRLDLLNKLHTMQQELKDARLIAMFDAELDSCKRYLSSGPAVAAAMTSEAAKVHEQSVFARFLLAAPSTTTKERVFKGLFYFFFSFFVLGLFAPIALMASGERDWPVAFVGAFFYLVLALIFRALAKARRSTA